MAGMEGDGRLMLLDGKVPVRMLFSLRSNFHLLRENLNERWTKVCRIVAICISTVSLLFTFLSSACIIKYRLVYWMIASIIVRPGSVSRDT